MPVDLPNPRIHKLCYRCGRWHEEHEGAFEPSPSGSPGLSGVRALSERLVGIDPRMRFVCARCQVRRRWAPVIWFGVVVGIVGLGLAGLEWCSSRDPQPEVDPEVAREVERP